MHVHGCARVVFDAIDRYSITAGRTQYVDRLLSADQVGWHGKPTVLIGMERNHSDEAQLPIGAQCIGEATYNIGGPQVLILDVDETVGAADDLLVGVSHTAFPVRCKRILVPAPGISPQDLYLMPAARRWIRKLRWELAGRGVFASDAVADHVDRIVGQPRGILPALAEHCLDVRDSRALNAQLHIVPRRTWPVDLCHRLTLVITPMLRPIQPAVAQVDATNEDHVQVGPAGMTQHDELLMMRSSRAHPHVSQALAAGRRDFVTQMAILLLTEGKLVQV